ncbi:MAG: hypothetical protein ABL967_14470 [Bryobacteraceae bacterium]
MPSRTPKTILLVFVFCENGGAMRKHAKVHDSRDAIFFLTFVSIHLIKGTQARCEQSGAYLDVRENQSNEKRNQEESGPEEESCCEEKEVANGLAIASLKPTGPEESGPILFCVDVCSMCAKARRLGLS